ncbi:hypothetical protein AD998_00240 [bacterium 336/3]|nr:hypothetical protein AD998_00240 [bacterium 336/3]
MQYFKKLNTILGWIAFLIATTVYLLTLEPTASYWDCGEFISASAKLEVPHPPGTPFFLLVNRMFAMLASEPSQVAYMVNLSSGLSSGFTILFLYWTISLLALKFFNYNKPDFEPTKAQTHSIMFASAVGALAYAFSDSFWFSAVEAEVYAMSSFLTGFIFWAMLKWDVVKEEKMANRWLLLIAYLIGISIGVHPLNLLTIPALAMIYYFNKSKNVTLKGTIYSILAGSAILVFLMWLIPGLPTLAKKIEVFFVNTIGLPFNSGILFLGLLIIGGIIYGIVYSIKKGKVLLNIGMLSFTLVLIGYASYGIILIRSAYNPPMDENNPEDLVTLISYLNREQYGSRPLLFGPIFTSQQELYEKMQIEQRQMSYYQGFTETPIYKKDEKQGKYVIVNYAREPIYGPEVRQMFFPRIHSTSQGHNRLYRSWLNIEEDETITMYHNLKFFFKFQLGHMYWRYFAWNFIGRESDIKDAGIALGGSSKNLPEYLAKNKARNNFFAIPLILGIVGIVFNILRNKQTAGIIGLLFLLTGMALIVYLNSPPIEPRERDYIYVGSFYAFAIWMGFGVLGLIEILEGVLSKNKPTPQDPTAGITYKNPVAWSVAGVLGVACVFLMLQQGWDDHNRSGRYYSVDSAKNLLSSCEPNSILFTGGDNDTFPLWYAQEVEGFRTDVRVCNTSLLGTDWYISQMKLPAYDSDPLPISLEEPLYRSGTNDVISVEPSPILPEKEAKKLMGEGIPLDQYLDLLKQKNQYILDDKGESILPSQKLLLSIEKDIDFIKKSGFLPAQADTLLKYPMYWQLPAKSIDKDELIMLDIIVNNHWKRPIYFATQLGADDYLGLKDYMQIEGLAYRLLPVPVGISTPKNKELYVNTDLSYDLFMKEKKQTFKGKEITRKMTWRGLDNPKVYHNEDYLGFIAQARENIVEIAEALIAEGKKDKAKELMLHSLKVIPIESIPYDVYVAQLVPLLFEAGEEKKATELYQKIGKEADLTLAYLNDNYNGKDAYRIQHNIYALSVFAQTLEERKSPDAAKYKELAMKYRQIYKDAFK